MSAFSLKTRVAELAKSLGANKHGIGALKVQIDRLRLKSSQSEHDWVLTEMD